MNEVNLKEVIHSSHNNILVYENEEKIKAHSKRSVFNGTVVKEVWGIRFIFIV